MGVGVGGGEGPPQTDREVVKFRGFVILTQTHLKESGRFRRAVVAQVASALKGAATKTVVRTSEPWSASAE